MGKKELSISAIREGTVIDHIPSEETFNVAEILKLKDSKGIVSVAKGLTSRKSNSKGIVKIAEKFLSQEEVNKISIVAPKATVNIIRNYTVSKKLKVSLPDEIISIIKCSNPNCITNKEKTETKFYVLDKNRLNVKCHYCERSMGKEDIVIL
jgi:aspartate carbamoyltransferase regulatory subunit